MVFSPPGRGFWGGLFCSLCSFLLRDKEKGTPLLNKPPWGHPGDSLGCSTESSRRGGHPGAPTAALQWAWPQISPPPPHVSCAGALRGTTLRFCGRADMAERSLGDGAMLKEPLLLDLSLYHEISGTKCSTCTMGHMCYGELISLIFLIPLRFFG